GSFGGCSRSPSGTSVTWSGRRPRSSARAWRPSSSDRTAGAQLRVWIDMTASAHVLVFRPLIGILRSRGDEVEITARDYAQTLQLLELHGLSAEVVGKHGGRSRAAKLRAMRRRLRGLRRWARERDFAVALAHGSA